MATYYSYRPKAGISVGVTLRNNNLIVATAFTHNGLNSFGVFHSEKVDQFNRKRAKQIINSRLLGEKQNNFVKIYPVNDTFVLGKFMSKFRAQFKPIHDESDSFELSRDKNTVNQDIEIIDNIVRDCLK